jgi:hypothetical protein
MRATHRLLLATVLVGVTACTRGGVAAVDVAGLVVAGPVCPVETVPADPSCAPRPVPGAEIAVRDASGNVVARASTDGDGGFRLSLAPGVYQLEPQPVEGLMGTGEPFELVVEAGEPIADLRVVYDTGIR